MKLRGQIKKPFDYVSADAMDTNYLRNKFARIRAQQKKEKEEAEREIQLKVRKIK